MKAFVLKKNNIRLEDVSIPELKPGQVLIKTKAVSLNPVDFKIIKGAFNLPKPRTIGIDVAGEIVEKASFVTNLKAGDRVCALVNIFETGSFAEYVAVDSSAVSLIPNNVSYTDASTIPCAGITAWQAVIQKINIHPQQKIFISAGGGGVGGYAIQFAKKKGAYVITSASKDFERISKLGADEIINYKKQDVLEEVLKRTENRGVDFMIDSISKENIAQHREMLRFNGMIVGITGLPEKYLYPPFSKAAGMVEVALVAAYTNGDNSILTEIAAVGSEIAHGIAEGKYETNIGCTIDFKDIPEGLDKLSGGRISGKLVAIL